MSLISCNIFFFFFLNVILGYFVWKLKIILLLYFGAAQGLRTDDSLELDF